VSPSELAFLALGIVLGAAIGAAIVEAVRSRPAPRREVRVTIAPNSVLPRRSTTLAAAVAGAAGRRMPGSPEDDAWREGPAATYLSGALAGRRSPGMAILDRTRVLSGTPLVPSTAIAVPVERPAGGRIEPARPASPTPDGGQAARPPGPSGPSGPSAASGPSRAEPRAEPRPGPWPDQGAPSATLGSALGAIAILEATAIAEDEDAGLRRPEATVRVTTPVLDVGVAAPEAVVRPRPPVELAPIVIAPAAIGLAIRGDAAAPVPRAAAGDGGGSFAPGASAASGRPGTDPCAPARVLMEERCAVASTAADQAKAAADALREAQRAYDTLRERVERAQADADPRGLAAAKDALHHEFRAATRRSNSAEETEAAAREWLTQINELNVRVRDAQRLADAGSAELRAAFPRLERMAVEADAARISAENAAAACHDAREQLATCEEAETEAARRAATPEPVAAGGGGDAATIDEAAPLDAWRHDPGDSFERQVPATQAALAGMPIVIRVLQGDRAARDRLVATLAASEPDGERAWAGRIAQLVGAITSRAIEDGYLDMPEDDTFWSLFTPREAREIVSALSALGYRFDGIGGFADERVPAQRDLSLAVGYAGLDRMRIRNWPREQELAELYQRATVAADEWLVHNAGDLSLGEMVDALGPRAGDLAEVWNAWGRVRPALLAPA
jgi:hypothetical protein